MKDEINIYVLMTKEGKISSETLNLIRTKLDNELAKNNVHKALKHGLEELQRANIYGLGFGNVTMWLVRTWDREAMHARLKIPFVNQDLHDADVMTKLSSLSEA